MKTAVIVQARYGSSRLPGKVLIAVEGKTFLRRILERCLAIERADVVCCAVPADQANDAVAGEAERCGVVVTRGPEKDVLRRYWLAAQELGADVIMRVTSDCPLLDPKICDDVLALREAEGADYATNNNPPTWPHGLDAEAFTAKWLDRAEAETVDPSDREHVAGYIRYHPEVASANLAGPGGDVIGHRWTLDTDSDLAFFRALLPLMPEGPAGWNWKVPLGIVRAHPEIARINEGLSRFAGMKTPQTRDKAQGLS